MRPACAGRIHCNKRSRPTGTTAAAWSPCTCRRSWRRQAALVPRAVLPGGKASPDRCGPLLLGPQRNLERQSALGRAGKNLLTSSRQWDTTVRERTRRWRERTRRFEPSFAVSRRTDESIEADQDTVLDERRFVWGLDVGVRGRAARPERRQLHHRNRG